jgi:hypothetical protein
VRVGRPRFSMLGDPTVPPADPPTDARTDNAPADNARADNA